MQSTILFSEKQRFSQWWVWLLLILLNGWFLFAIYDQLFGPHPVNDAWLLLTGAVFILLTLLFAVMRLETEIRTDGIYVRFFPFHLRFRHYAPRELENYYMRTYSSLVEYGGWGMRVSLSGAGKLYNVSGKEGLQLVFPNGKRLLIGTQQPEALSAALKVLQEKYS
jgi:hypothetical protein